MEFVNVDTSKGDIAIRVSGYGHSVERTISQESQLVEVVRMMRAELLNMKKTEFHRKAEEQRLQDLADQILVALVNDVKSQ